MLHVRTTILLAAVTRTVSGIRYATRGDIMAHASQENKQHNQHIRMAES